MSTAKTTTKGVLLKSTLSNYLLFGLRFFSMLYLSRLFFLNLSRTEYGFWAFLWSCFGFAGLFNLGLGAAAEKETAALNTQDLRRYQTLLQTFVLSFGLIALMVACCAVVGSVWLPHLLSTGGQHYRSLFLLFGLGTAFFIPWGLAADLLRGLQKIYFKAWIELLFWPFYVAGMVWVIHQHWGLYGMVWVALIQLWLTHILMALLALRYLPPLRWFPLRFDLGLLVEMLRFGLMAYLINLTRLLLKYTDQFLITLFLSLDLLAGYHILIRLSDLFLELATQMHLALAPLAARLHAEHKQAQINRVLLQSNRFITLLATPVFLILVLELKPLLKLWLDLQDADILNSGYILLCSNYSYVVLRSSSTRILTMSGQERLLAVLAVFEVLGNIVLSLLLAKGLHLGLVGIALGTLIPGLVSTLYLLPRICRFASVSLWHYLRQTTRGLSLAVLAELGLSVVLSVVLPVTQFWSLLVHLVLLASAYLLVLVIWGLLPSEKTLLAGVFRQGVRFLTRTLQRGKMV